MGLFDNFFGGGDMPDTPNYEELARKQAASDKAALAAQTLANRPTQITGRGKTSWVKDANGNWTQTTALNPTLAGAQTAEQGTQRGLWEGAQGMVPGALGSVSQPWDTSGAPMAGDPRYGATQEVIDATMGQMRPELDRQAAAERARLVSMGLRGGQDAYWSNEHDISDRELNARQRAVLAGTQEAGNVFNRQNTARNQWLGESLAKRQMPMQELTGLMRLGGHVGEGIEAPGFESAGRQAPIDYLGAGGQQYSADMGQWNAREAASPFNKLLNVGSKVASAWAGSPSGSSTINGWFGG